ncbi:ROK family transcriptional regulator [uncultured Microbacterium sp.]|uniref:ROK family transcriptional regulator n=1 Tax=uncultured Microbacterium sp. TaxID=191216 RepID=UPI002613F918|nr:ROK family transcriptional regulator [uncultured Microbacterium sp.]
MLTPTGVHALVRRTHEDRVLQALREHGALTRAELSAQIGLSRTTLSEITASLLEREVISTLPPRGPIVGRGRPAERLRLDPSAGQYVGIDFRHSLVRVAVANAARELIASDTAAYASESTWDDRIRTAFELVDAMSASAGINVDSVRGIAVGLPGPFSSRLPRPAEQSADEARRADAQRVRSAFAERYGADVLLDNNTRLAALAEATWHTRDGVDDLLYIRLSFGIGGGLVIDGRLVSGSTRIAGEFGHTRVGGISTECRCGKRGCLETIASIDALLRRCREADVPVASLDEVRAAAEKGDPIVLRVIRETGAAVGEVLGGLAIAVNPAEIVIGGEVAMISDTLIEQIAETVAYELLPVGSYGPRVRRTELGDEGGAIGGIVALLRRTPLLSGYPQDLAASTAPSGERTTTSARRSGTNG